MQKMEDALEEFVGSLKGRAWWRDRFYKYTVSVPTHDFHAYVGAISDSTILFTMSRDEPAEDVAKAVLRTMIEEDCPIAADSTYRKFPLSGTRFQSCLALPPSYHERFLHEADHLHPHTIECFPIFDCEFSGSESNSEFEAIQRCFCTFDPLREPSPQCSVRCSIPVSEIQIPEWYTCQLSELESYLFVLSEHRRGDFEVRNIRGEVLAVDPTLGFKENKKSVREHLTSI